MRNGGSGTTIRRWIEKMPNYLAIGDVLVTAPSGADAVALPYAGSAWAPGAWQELCAGVGAYGAILQTLTLKPGTYYLLRTYVFDIGVGSAGSEVVIATAKIYCAETSYLSGALTVLPIGVNIPAGARLTARLRASGTHDASSAKASVGYINQPIGGVWESTDQLLQVIPETTHVAFTSAADWVNTAWVEATAASVASALVGIGIRFTGVNDTVGHSVIDVGVGAAGVEEVVVSMACANETSSPTQNERVFSPLPCPVEVAAGTRIAVRVRGGLDEAESNVQVWLAYMETPL